MSPDVLGANTNCRLAFDRFDLSPTTLQPTSVGVRNGYFVASLMEASSRTTLGADASERTSSAPTGTHHINQAHGDRG